jgi:hypothetical protein
MDFKDMPSFSSISTFALSESHLTLCANAGRASLVFFSEDRIVQKRNFGPVISSKGFKRKAPDEQ